MKKNKITGLIGTAVLHILLLILLLVIAIRRPQVQEEGVFLLCWEIQSFLKGMPTLIADGYRYNE